MEAKSPNVIEGFEKAENPFPSHGSHARVGPCQVAAWELKQILPEVFQRCGYAQHSLDPNQNYARASLTEALPGRLALQTNKVIEVSWQTGTAREDVVLASWVVYDDTNRPHLRYNEAAAQDFEDKLNQTVDARVKGRKAAAPPRELILGPGESLDESFYARAPKFALGSMRDYSGCAAAGELQDLRTGAWLLGRSVSFGTAVEGISSGPELYLPGDGLANGALVCGPAKAGKTSLLARWALEANRQGYNVLAIDGNGRLSAAIRPYLCGTVYRVSTRARDSDRIDFLAGGDGKSPIRETERIERLVEGLLPERPEAPGDVAQQRIWLTALIQLLKRSASGEPPELSDLYELVTDEARFDRLVDPPTPDSMRWVKAVAGLMDRVRHEALGRRDPELFFEQLTRPLADALKHFAGFEKDTGRLFRLDRLLAGGGPPVTVIVEAMDDDGDKAAALLRATFAKMQQILGDPQFSGEHKALFLLDELRSVPVTAPRTLAAAARLAQIGCVQAYSSLDRLADRPEKVLESMSEVGVHVYLSGVTANTARYLVELLPKRRRQTVKGGSGFDGAQGNVLRLDLGWDYNQDYFTSLELANLPGDWPALVLVNYSRSRKPFLVDCLARTFTVTPDGDSASLPLPDALEQARAGDVVLAKPGTYRHSALLKDGVMLVGDGAPGQAVLNVDGFVAVHLDAGRALVRNFTVRVNPGSDNPAALVPAVYAGGGFLVVDRCDLGASPGPAVAAKGAGAQVRIFNSSLTSSGYFGLALFEGAWVEADDCDIFESPTSGVCAQTGSGILRRCRIRASKLAGVCWSGAGNVELADCDIHDNGMAGVELSATATGKAVRCHVHGNGLAAFLHDGGAGEFAECDFDGNGDAVDAATVLVQAGSRASLAKCRVSAPKRGGVLATGEAAKAELNDCEVTGCGGAGVAAAEKGTVVVRSSRIQRNRLGVATTQGGSATVSGSDLTGNAEGAWSIGDGTVVDNHENRET